VNDLNNTYTRVAREQVQKRAMLASLNVTLIMLVGKGGAYYYTQSTAILADFAESVVHLLVTGFSAYSVYLAAKPPDKKHPYGHDRVVVFSIGFEGAIVAGTGVFIFFEAIKALLIGSTVHNLAAGIGISVFLALVNFALGLYLVRTGREYNAPVVEANGKHVLTDMWTSIAMIVGLGVVWTTGVLWLDPIIALIAAVHISRMGIGILKRAVNQGMDEAAPVDTEKITTVLARFVQDKSIVNFHQLRHREVNGNRWIEVHFLFIESISLKEAHHRATKIEEALDRAFPEGNVYITSHLEPDQHGVAHPEGHEPPDALID